MQSTTRIHQANWPLMSLILVSAVCHFLLLSRVTGLQPVKTPSYLEIELAALPKTPEKKVQLPPTRPKPVVKPVTQPRPVPVRRAKPAVKPSPRTPLPPVAIPAPPLPTATVKPIPSAVTEPVTQPERPKFSQTAPAARPAPEPASPSVPDGAGFTSRSEYFNMVRTAIEKRKQYPPAAVRRQIEGKVRVRFVLDPDGRIKDIVIVDKSRHSVLNQAALEAVRDASPLPRPPARLFNGPIPLDIVITFELT